MASRSDLALSELISNAEDCIRKVYAQSAQLDNLKLSHHPSTYHGEFAANTKSHQSHKLLTPPASHRAAEPDQPISAVQDELIGAARVFIRDGVLPTSSTLKSGADEESQRNMMVLESLSREHSHQIESLALELHQMRRDYFVLQEKYEDLQVSSSVQMTDIANRRDLILHNLQQETMARVAKEKVLQEAVAVIQRLTGRKFSGVFSLYM